LRRHQVEDGICTYQLFGDYTPAAERIRVWMRKAIRALLISPKALLNTLLHEPCHHIDNAVWSCPEAHTRAASSAEWTTCTTWRSAPPPRRAVACTG
jgi:hypothetical protein